MIESVTTEELHPKDFAMPPQLLTDSPDRDALVRALVAIGSHTHGRPLTSDDLRHSQEETLAGMLLAAAEGIVDQGRTGSRGKSRGHLAVRGYMKYLGVDNLRAFFAARATRLGADMNSYESMYTNPHR
ncbi:hypothetical protein [Streptosporangium sp. NPDC087985]|uniref:hypothetical protein n=1 Tax=Streptosporangium sp. NPDC087985 TaxID=3366196 RepID=UPI00382160F9